MSQVNLVVIPICLYIFIVVTLVLCLLFCWKKRKTQIQDSFFQPFPRLSYGSILRATNKFSTHNLIGSGFSSDVYKGIIEPDGVVVAIKVLKLGNHGALRSFVAECEALKSIRHRNLVKIITSCSSVDFQGNEFKALVYEYMPNGDLESWLHPNSVDKRELSFLQRVRIALDVANAIHYLHQDCKIPVIHCDLKPTNILLDNDMVAHVADFGLAKFLPSKQRQTSTIGIRGTSGYAPPEYGVGNAMTKRGDMYSFGILLLEMMIGKRPTDPIFQDGLNLHAYVKMALPDHIMEIIAPTGLFPISTEAMNTRNSGETNRLEEGIVSLARVGLACSMKSSRERMNTTSLPPCSMSYNASVKCFKTTASLLFQTLPLPHFTLSCG